MEGSASRRVRSHSPVQGCTAPGTHSASRLALPSPKQRRQPPQAAKFTSSSAAPFTANSRSSAALARNLKIDATGDLTLVQPCRCAADGSRRDIASATLAFDGTRRKSGSQSDSEAVAQNDARMPFTAGSLPYPLVRAHWPATLSMNASARISRT